MSPEKWQSVKSKIQDAFKDVEITQEELEAPERGQAEILEFSGPLGQMRVEYWTKPVVLGKNVSGSRRAGSHHEVDYIYSETEVMHLLKAHRYDNTSDEWLEIDLSNSFNL
jgi:hypothetical protein